jgi:hypothetical protein
LRGGDEVLNLAASGVRKKTVNSPDLVASIMTPAQIAEA